MNESRYVQACTQFVDGVCNAYEWFILPGQSWMTVGDALMISGAIGGLWAAAYAWVAVRRAV